MFVVQLKFTDLKSKAPQFMEAHNAWLKQGFDEGIFLLSGSLQPRTGGAIMAAGISAEELAGRIAADPFVAERIVVPEVIEIDPGHTDDRLAFLVA